MYFTSSLAVCLDGRDGRTVGRVYGQMSRDANWGVCLLCARCVCLCECVCVCLCECVCV